MIKYVYHKLDEKILEINEEKTLFLKDEKEYVKFIENIILINSIILKEEKETLLFYHLLDKKEKDMLNIKEYFDCIDIAYNYYELMEKLYLNNIVKENILVDSWKIKQLDLVYNIHSKMINYAKKNNIVPRYLKYYNYKLNNKFISQYNKIIIINKFNINKIEKEILEKLDLDIEIHLYIDKNDYDEKENLLKNISYEKYNKNIKAISFKNKAQLNIYLTQYLSENMEKEIDICDVSTDKKVFNKINQNLLDCNLNIKCDTTTSYKILYHIYQILNGKNLIYPIYNAIKDEDFVKFFEIDNKIILEITNQLKKSIKYTNILKLDINLDDIIEKLANYYPNEADTLLEAYTEIIAINDFDFNYILSDINTKLMILLKYLQHKNLKLYKQETKFRISNINEDPSNNLILLNLQEDIIKNNNIFILDTKDRNNLSIKNSQDYKYEKYYSYIRKILLSNNVILLYVENIDTDTNAYSIFNDFILSQNIKVEKFIYSTNDIINFNNTIYDTKEYEYNRKFLTKNDYISIKENTFDNLVLNAYNIEYFIDSPINLYLNMKLKEKNISNIDVSIKSIDDVTIGNIIHKIFQYSIENKKYSLEEIFVIKDKVLQEYKEYILKEYFEFYDKIVFSSAIETIFKYLSKIKNFNIYTEKATQMNIQGLNFSVKEDIVYYDNSNNRNIVDIKTGKYSISDLEKKVSKTIQLALYTYLANKKEEFVASRCLYYPFEDKIFSDVKITFDDDMLILGKNMLTNAIAESRICINNDNVIYGFEEIMRSKDYEKDKM